MTTFPTIFLVVITGLLMTTTLVNATTPTPTIAPTSGPTTTTTSPTTDSDTTTCDCINDYSCQDHTFDGTTCKVLNCIGQNSCRDAVITNLDIVNCIGEDSCKDADISYITWEINCLGKSSCAQQQVSNVNDASIWNFLGDGVVVNCLGDSSCFDTDIYANENRAMNECDHDDTENHCSSITIVCGDGDGDDGMACGYSHLSHGPDGSIICRGNDNANSYLDATCFETNTPAEIYGATKNYDNTCLICEKTACYAIDSHGVDYSSSSDYRKGGVTNGGSGDIGNGSLWNNDIDIYTNGCSKANLCNYCTLYPDSIADFNQDGIPDCIEDSNNNGIIDFCDMDCYCDEGINGNCAEELIYDTECTTIQCVNSFSCAITGFYGLESITCADVDNSGDAGAYCFMSYMELADNGMLNCTGVEACGGATIIGNGITVVCNGDDACSNANIRGDNNLDDDTVKAGIVLCTNGTACGYDTMSVESKCLICDSDISCYGYDFKWNGVDIGDSNIPTSYYGCDLDDLCNYCTNLDPNSLADFNGDGTPDCIVDSDNDGIIDFCDPDTTLQPSITPTLYPTITPTTQPTIAPTSPPTIVPTIAPTIEPTVFYDDGTIPFSGNDEDLGDGNSGDSAGSTSTGVDTSGDTKIDIDSIQKKLCKWFSWSC